MRRAAVFRSRVPRRPGATRHLLERAASLPCTSAATGRTSACSRAARRPAGVDGDLHRDLPGPPGRIAEGWINWDWLAVLEQLGCIQRVETVSA